MNDTILKKNLLLHLSECLNGFLEDFEKILKFHFIVLKKIKIHTVAIADFQKTKTTTC
jgi:hypothetical protein